jgi:hypothetical protein
MTVKELIEALSKFDEDWVVVDDDGCSVVRVEEGYPVLVMDRSED